MQKFIGKGKEKFIIPILSFLLLLVFILSPVKTVQADNSVWMYDPYPQGRVGISSPEIGWKIILGDNLVEKAEFIINGTTYTPTFDQTRDTFYIIPRQALSGNIDVKAKIKLKNWWNLLEKNWSFQIDSTSLQSLSYPNSQQQKAVDYANDYRYSLNLPLLEIEPALNMAAQKHAEYQAKLGVLTHFEDKKNSGFFGESVQERANYFGFYGLVAEDISYNSNPSVQKSVDDLFDAPYHRIPFLNPALTRFGYGENKTYSVLNFGSVIEQSQPIWVAYPGPGHENVPVEWVNYETPDPLRFYPNASQRVGYPIMVGTYGKNIANINLVEAKLWDQNGVEVPTYINSPKGLGNVDDHLKQEIIIIPKNPLSYNTDYKIKVTIETFDANGNKNSLSKNWSFKTVNKSVDGKQKLHQTFKYPDYQETAKQFKLFLGQRFIWLNEVPYPLDIAPFVENKRTMIPFRAVGNILGAEVQWNGTTQTVQYVKGSTTIQIPINSSVVYVNNKKIIVDQPAIIENSRSFVPIRFVTEQLGAKVAWYPQTQAVIIELP